MAGKKKIELFINIHNEKEFETVIKHNTELLICAEIYSNAFGSCTALDKLFTTMKLDWSNGKLVLLKVPADEIEALKRFKDHSEPVYIFILNGKVTKVFRGVDSVRFAEVAKKELSYYRQLQAGVTLDRPVYELDEPTPDEMEWMLATESEKQQEMTSLLARRSARQAVRKRHRATLMVPYLSDEWMLATESEKQQEMTSLLARRSARQAVRKRHRATLMVPYLSDVNFVLFWPHCFHAHPELYEQWDANNIIMVGREEVEMTEEKIADIFYAGDAPLNEASLHKLMSGRALAICFRLLEPDVNFVSLVRRILYEEEPPWDEGKSMASLTTAYDRYKTYSPTREEFNEQRRKEQALQKEELREKQANFLSETRRLARLAKEEALEAKRKEKEQRKLDLLKAGDLSALEKLKEEPDDELSDEEEPEVTVEEEEEESMIEEEPEEYLPPPGLLIPGFYAPPNDIAKSNGLAVLFPKLVLERVTPQPEFLPKHVLVLLEISKRHKAIEAIKPFKHAVIHMGIFKASSPYKSVHIAYSVKQYDTLDSSSTNLDQVKLAFMLSVVVDVPLLHLMDLNPLHVSRDCSIGEEECAAMFPVDYGDEYPQFEDFEDVE